MYVCMQKVNTFSNVTGDVLTHYKQEIRSVELSLSNATFFIFDHVMFMQFKICCCVLNLIESG